MGQGGQSRTHLENSQDQSLGGIVLRDNPIYNSQTDSEAEEEVQMARNTLKPLTIAKNLQKYIGSGDALKYMQHFETTCTVVVDGFRTVLTNMDRNEIMQRAFPMCLAGIVGDWYVDFPEATQTWDNLCVAFISQFQPTGFWD